MATTFRSLTDRAVSTLALFLGSGATSLTLAAGTGSLFPAGNFVITIENEHLLCTTRIGDVLTVTRAQEGTSAADHSAGVSVELRVVVSLFTDVHAAVNAIEDGTFDLTTYLKLAGRSGGQVAYGGTGSGDGLTFRSSSHGTKGPVVFEQLTQLDLDIGAITSDFFLSDGGAGNPRVNLDSGRYLEFDRTAHIFQAVLDGQNMFRIERPYPTGGVGSNQLSFAGFRKEPTESGAKQFFAFNASIDTPDGSTTLAADIDNAVTSLDVAPGTGASLPAVNFLVRIDSEVMRVTNVTVDTLTVQRAQVGTSAAAHLTGATVGIVAGGDFRVFVSEPIYTSAHGLAGNGAIGFKFGNRWRNAGGAGGLVGFQGAGLILDASSVNFGVIQNVRAVDIQAVSRISANPTGQVDEAYGIRISDSTAGNYSLGTQYGIRILELAKGLTNFGLHSTENRHVFQGGGYPGITRLMPGLELSGGSMNTTTNAYTPALKFMSTDPQFTTENPKLLAFIVGRAQQTYGADTDGGMSLVFGATPGSPGATNVPVEVLHLHAEGARVVGYARVGTSTVPANTTPGDLTFIRGFAETHVRVGGDDVGSAGDGADGVTAISRTMSGFELVADEMNTTNKFGPALKFLSTDSAFTTENPKLLAYIVGEALQTFSTDTTGGMALSFGATPLTPGATNIPVEALRLHSDGGRVPGYLRVGNTAAPANATAGDLTVVRLDLGQNTAFSATAGYFAKFVGTMTDTSGGAKIGFNFGPTISPAADSTSEFRVLNMSALVSTSDVGVGTVRTMNMEIDYRALNPGATGDVTSVLNGVSITPVVLRSTNDARQAVSNAHGVYVNPYSRPSGTGTVSITNLFGVFVDGPTSAGATVTDYAAFRAVTPGASFTPTNEVLVDIGQALRGTAMALGIRNGGRYVALPPAATNITAVGNTFPSNAEAIQFTASASHTLTSAPSIAAGQVNGQRLYLINVDTVDTVTIQDETALAGSGVRTKTGANVVMVPQSVWEFIWDNNNAKWFLVS